ncbi:MAG TPA: hypothetical protein VD865_00825 [Stenotrophomonas sp.]|nr:hypothetical protein [Stenotrophomonas sp.]
MPTRMRCCIGASERSAVAVHLGRHALDALQRHTTSAARSTRDDVLALDPRDRLAMTSAGLCLLRIGCSDRCETLWLALRLPHAVSAAPALAEAGIDPRSARAAVARARWLWRMSC